MTRLPTGRILVESPSCPRSVATAVARGPLPGSGRPNLQPRSLNRARARDDEITDRADFGRIAQLPEERCNGGREGSAARLGSSKPATALVEPCPRTG